MVRPCVEPGLRTSNEPYPRISEYLPNGTIIYSAALGGEDLVDSLIEVCHLPPPTDSSLIAR